MLARGIQSFDQNGPWQAGGFSNDQNVYLNLEQTYDIHVLKILKRCLNSYLSKYWFTENLS